jgi:hypothetical protein
MITFRSYSTSASSSSKTRTVPEPTGAAEGDLLIALATLEATDYEQSSFDTISGWTRIENVVTDVGAAESCCAVYYRVRGATTVGDTTFTYLGEAPLSQNIRCTIAAYSGVDTATPFDVTYARASHYVEHIDNAVGAPASITTATADAMVVLIQKVNINVFSGEPGAPSGYALNVSENGSIRRLHFFASKTVASPGVESPGVWTHAGVGSSQDSSTFTIALKPAGASARMVPVVEPLYYGATLLASKTNLKFKITAGTDSLAGALLGSGANGTTDGSGNFVLPEGVTLNDDGVPPTANDPAFLHLYWEEGNPAVDRSLIVKTTLVAA